MTVEQNFLNDILILLISAVTILSIFTKKKINSILGYFFAGAIIGEYGFNFIKSEEMQIVAEMGIIFLLFVIGLEINLERLKKMKFYIFIIGSLQIIITTLLLVLIIYHFKIPLINTFIIACTLSLSSTAIVLQIISDNYFIKERVKKLTLSTLLMQDFVIMPILIIVPLIKDNSTNLTSSMLESLVKGIVAICGLLFLGRIILRPLLKQIAIIFYNKNTEIITALTILIALGSAWITKQMGLSVALGAFIAGVLVGETEFDKKAYESIIPFKKILLGLFFMSVGMTIDIRFLVINLKIIALFSFILITIKFFVMFFLSYFFQNTLSNSFLTAALLAQGGEFSFILLNLHDIKESFNEFQLKIILLVIVVSMMITPLLSKLLIKISIKLNDDVNLDDMSKYYQLQLFKKNNDFK